MPMPNKLHIRLHESADAVFQMRKDDLLDRILSLHHLVNQYNPYPKDHRAIANLDYILDSLDNVIKDTKERTGLSD